MKMEIDVTQRVCVELREEAFTDEFMAEFRRFHYQFDTIEEHAKHIAQLVARGLYNEVGENFNQDQFVEGYGPIGEFVKNAQITDTEVEEA